MKVSLGGKPRARGGDTGKILYLTSMPFVSSSALVVDGNEKLVTCFKKGPIFGL